MLTGISPFSILHCRNRARWHLLHMLQASNLGLHTTRPQLATRASNPSPAFSLSLTWWKLLITCTLDGLTFTCVMMLLQVGPLVVRLAFDVGLIGLERGSLGDWAQVDLEEY